MHISIENKVLKTLTKIIIWSVIGFILASLIMILLNTNVFIYPLNSRGQEVYNAIFQFDTPGLITNNDPFNVRHILYPIVYFPFDIIAHIIKNGIFFLTNLFGIEIEQHLPYAFGYLYVQILIYIIIGKMLYRIINERFDKRLSKLLLIIFMISGCLLLPTIAIERWIFNIFLVVSLFYVLIFHNKNYPLKYAVFLANCLCVTSSVLLWPCLIIFDLENWRKNIKYSFLFLFIGFFLIIICGQFSIITNFISGVSQNIETYGYTGISLIDRIKQFLEFLSSLVFIPNYIYSPNCDIHEGCFADIYTRKYEMIIGAVILCIMIFTIIKKRKEKLVLTSAYWFLASILLVFVLGYGMKQHETYLYAGYFYVAYFIIMLFFLDYLLKKIKPLKKYIRLLLFIIISSMLLMNGYRLFNIAKTSSEQFPIDIYINKVNSGPNANYLDSYLKQPQFYFLFGMGNRRKLIFINNKLEDIYTNEIIGDYTGCSTQYIPDNYEVKLKCNNDDISIYENEKGVYLKKNNHTSEVTSGDIKLLDFKGYKYEKTLRLLQHEILINIVDGKPMPNLLVYDKPWYRDSAMISMALKKMNNINLISDWIMNLKDVYDYNNGNPEPDNLGEALYMISLVSDKNHPLVSKILKEAEKIKKGHLISGLNDNSFVPIYQTKWLKLGLQSLGLDDASLYTDSQTDAYSSLFWIDNKKVDEKYNFNKQNLGNYPYLEWAKFHYYQYKDIDKYIKASYPLTYESNASKADYTKLSIISNEYVKNKISPIHSWTASEMFLYLIDL